MKSVVLFDLDGTLADTALDLGQAVNCVRQELSLPLIPLADYRPYASQGARGLLGFGLSQVLNDENFEYYRAKFLAFYQTDIASKTTLFNGVRELLDSFENRGVVWGIVTNKAFSLAQKVVDALNLSPAVLIGGDSALYAKPHPAPLLMACEKLAVSPHQCIYVGDDERDVQAGRAAGMTTVAIGFGYCAHGATPKNWGADVFCETVSDFRFWLVEHIGGF